MKLIKKEDHKVLSTDLKESTVISNLMDDFPASNLQARSLGGQSHVHERVF